MKKLSIRRARAVIVAIAFFGSFALFICACDSGTATDEIPQEVELGGLGAALVNDLELGENQIQGVQRALSRYDEQSPGYLWYAAAELHRTLTDEQITSLLEKRSALREQGASLGPNAGKSQRRRARRGNDEFSSSLTTEQQELMKGVREKFEPQFRALVEERRDGTLSRESFRDQATALHEALRLEVAEILTEDQQAELEELRANRPRGLFRNRASRQGQRRLDDEAREEAIEAMAEALSLSADQKEQLKNLREARMEKLKATREEIQQGEASRESLREAFQGWRESRREELSAVLTKEQLEVVDLYAALRVMRRPRQENGLGRARQHRFGRNSR